MVSDKEKDLAFQFGKELVETLSMAVNGKTSFLMKLVTGLVCGGHVLIEDVPGVGKTTAVKALAQVFKAKRGVVMFRRIQFTPDLLPYDITGVDIFDPESRSFRFQPGPVFSAIVLADEINRATPKVQSALLEAMEEGSVTVGNYTRPLHPLFFVAATQNPHDMEGTYPLPAAQLDRFLFQLSVGYPEEEDELRILNEVSSRSGGLNLSPLFSAEEALKIRETSHQVFVDPKITALVRSVLVASRKSPEVKLGLSPRAGIHLLRAVRVWALFHGRNFVTDQDVLDLGIDVFAHRMLLKNTQKKSTELVENWIRDEIKKQHC